MNHSFIESWRRESGRVIIFSGTFDPVHKGHLAVAEAALKTEGGLVIFLPERELHERELSAKPKITNFDDRVNMLRIAIRQNDKLHVLESPFKKHTIVETLGWLREQFPENQNFGLLFGADVAPHITSWPGVDCLAEFGVDRLIIANRVTNSTQDIEPIKIQGVGFRLLRAPNDHLMSTLIRRDMKSRAASLPSGVQDYIKKNGLYTSG